MNLLEAAEALYAKLKNHPQFHSVGAGSGTLYVYLKEGALWIPPFFEGFPVKPVVVGNIEAPPFTS